MTSFSPAIAVPFLMGGLAALLTATPAGAALYANNSAPPRLICIAAELDRVRSRLGAGVEALAYREMLAKCDQYITPG